MRKPERYHSSAKYLGACLTMFVHACASTSTYQEIADSFFSLDRNYGPNYETTWRPLNASVERESVAQQRRLFEESVNTCVERLEREKQDFVGARKLNDSLATIQLSQCLKEEGWELSVGQAITLSAAQEDCL
jgi:hypothetical protein